VHAAPRWPVGLRQDQRNVVAGIDEPRERGRGELGRAGED
jgi:hypothetical protein